MAAVVQARNELVRRGEVSLELTAQLATLQQLMEARDDRIVTRVGSQCEQLRWSI